MKKVQPNENEKSKIAFLFNFLTFKNTNFSNFLNLIGESFLVLGSSGSGLRDRNDSGRNSSDTRKIRNAGMPDSGTVQSGFHRNWRFQLLEVRKKNLIQTCIGTTHRPEQVQRPWAGPNKWGPRKKPDCETNCLPWIWFRLFFYVLIVSLFGSGVFHSTHLFKLVLVGVRIRSKLA